MMKLLGLIFKRMNFDFSTKSIYTNILQLKAIEFINMKVGIE